MIFNISTVKTIYVEAELPIMYDSTGFLIIIIIFIKFDKLNIKIIINTLNSGYTSILIL
jgi:hypothetical protein